MWSGNAHVLDGQLVVHMFFAAKIDDKALAERLPQATADGAVGYAVAKDGDLTHWTLKPPLQLPAAYSKYELPIVIKRGDQFVLFSSVVELRPNSRQQSVRAYRSDAIDGKWQPIKGDSDKILDMKNIYGLNVAKGANGRDYYGISFYDNKDLTLSPLSK